MLNILVKVVVFEDQFLLIQNVKMTMTYRVKTFRYTSRVSEGNVFTLLLK